MPRCTICDHSDEIPVTNPTSEVYNPYNKVLPDQKTEGFICIECFEATRENYVSLDGDEEDL
jgi:hypothetical protein